MHLNRLFHKKVLLSALGLYVGLASMASQAVTLNFSASLVQGTCSLSLDKSVLPLGTLSPSSLRNGVLTNVQPFTLTVGNCSGLTGGSLQPVITVNGDGSTQDGKWLFRTSGSNVGGAGVMVVQSATLPTYANTEVKSGDYFPLAAVGQIPVNKQLPFFAGVSCGGSSGCATVQPGTLTANIMFAFTYR